jgi:hypothetical protein
MQREKRRDTEQYTSSRLFFQNLFPVGSHVVEHFEVH